MRALTCLLALLPVFAEAQRDPIPFDEPDVITFGSDRFVPPDPARHEVELGEGLVAFVAEDPGTETVELTALIGASRLDDPEGKTGLAAGVASAIRTHPGSANQLYAMAGRLSVTVDNEHTRVAISFLKEDLAGAIELFAVLLRRPDLSEEGLARYRRAGARPQWDPDDPRRRPEFELPRILYGDHPAGTVPTEATLAAIGARDLAAFHERFFVPNNIVLAVSGGIDRVETMAALKKALFADPWSRKNVTHAPVPAIPKAAPRKIHVWDVDRLQGWMLAGHLGRRGREKDHAALEVANYILGGGGGVWKRIHPELPPTPAEGHFDARLFNESRAKRGLTNDTSSYVPAGFRVPGLCYAVTLGRPEAIAYLLKIVDDEWQKIGEDVEELDVEIAKGALTEGYFQMRYAGAHATALSLAEERFFEGNHDWSRGYVKAIRGVSRADVLAAARKYFRPEDLVVVLVGPLEAIRSSEHPLYKAKLEDFGEIVLHPW